MTTIGRTRPSRRRLKSLRLLGVLTLLGVPLASCDQVEPSLPDCTIVGRVTVDGVGIDGVSVTLSTGQSTSTSDGGHFRFDNVAGDRVTLTLTGLPSSLAIVTGPAIYTISCNGGTHTVGFNLSTS